jgi:hypothetical protein
MKRAARRRILLAAAAAALGLALACDGNPYVSVGMGVAVPAPWGAVSVTTAVPVGPTRW